MEKKSFIVPCNIASSIETKGTLSPLSMKLAGYGKATGAVSLIVNDQLIGRSGTFSQPEGWNLYWSGHRTGLYKITVVPGSNEPDDSIKVTDEQNGSGNKLAPLTPLTPLIKDAYQTIPIKLIGYSYQDEVGSNQKNPKIKKTSGLFHYSESGGWTLTLSLPSRSQGHFVYRFDVKGLVSHSYNTDSELFYDHQTLYGIELHLGSNVMDDNKIKATTVTLSGKCLPGDYTVTEYLEKSIGFSKLIFQPKISLFPVPAHYSRSYEAVRVEPQAKDNRVEWSVAESGSDYTPLLPSDSVNDQSGHGNRAAQYLLPISSDAVEPKGSKNEGTFTMAANDGFDKPGKDPEPKVVVIDIAVDQLIDQKGNTTKSTTKENTTKDNLTYVPETQVSIDEAKPLVSIPPSTVIETADSEMGLKGTAQFSTEGIFQEAPTIGLERWLITKLDSFLKRLSTPHNLRNLNENPVSPPAQVKTDGKVVEQIKQAPARKDTPSSVIEPDTCQEKELAQAPEIVIHHWQVAGQTQLFSGTFKEPNIKDIKAYLEPDDANDSNDSNDPKKTLPLAVNITGHWQATGLHPLEPGKYTLLVTITNQAGSSTTVSEKITLAFAAEPNQPIAIATIDPASMVSNNTRPVIQGTLSDIIEDQLEKLHLELAQPGTKGVTLLSVKPGESWNIQVPHDLDEGSYPLTLSAMNHRGQKQPLSSDVLDIFGDNYCFRIVKAEGATLVGGNLMLPREGHGVITIKTTPESEFSLVSLIPTRGTKGIRTPDGMLVITVDKMGFATFDLSKAPAAKGCIYTTLFELQKPELEYVIIKHFYMATPPTPVFHYSFDNRIGDSDWDKAVSSLTFRQISHYEGSLLPDRNVTHKDILLGKGYLINEGLPSILGGNFTVCADIQLEPGTTDFTLLGRTDGLMILTLNDRGQIGLSAIDDSVYAHSILGSDIAFHQVCLARSVNKEGTQSSVSIAIDGKLEVQDAHVNHPAEVNTDITVIAGHQDQDQGQDNRILLPQGRLDNLKIFNLALTNPELQDAYTKDLYVLWGCVGYKACPQTEFLPLGLGASTLWTLTQKDELYLEFSELAFANARSLKLSTGFNVRFNGHLLASEDESSRLFKLTEVNKKSLSTLEVKPVVSGGIYTDDNNKEKNLFGYQVKIASRKENSDIPEFIATVDSDRTDFLGIIHNIPVLPKSHWVMHFQGQNTHYPMQGEEPDRAVQQDHFYAIEGGKVKNFDPNHDTIHLDQLLTGDHKIPASAKELASLLCTQNKDRLIDHILIRHKEKDLDHCDCTTEAEPAYTVGLAAPMNHFHLSLNYEDQYYDIAF